MRQVFMALILISFNANEGKNFKFWSFKVGRNNKEKHQTDCKNSLTKSHSRI